MVLQNQETGFSTLFMRGGGYCRPAVNLQKHKLSQDAMAQKLIMKTISSHKNRGIFARLALRRRELDPKPPKRRASCDYNVINASENHS